MCDYWQSCILLFINMLFIDGLLESFHDKNEAKPGFWYNQMNKNKISRKFVLLSFHLSPTTIDMIQYLTWHNKVLPTILLSLFYYL